FHFHRLFKSVTGMTPKAWQQAWRAQRLREALEQGIPVTRDEFHERSLQADLALALLLDVQQGLRDDLKLLIMSATLDNDRLQRLLRAQASIATAAS
ncbi:hypothetical protein, partial [Klebsiella pneumoniae]|uniref:hypothetical protein n=1 Tax=Klebsiella pneumoniae TaxID=573 RepID=UPI00210D8F35